MNDKVIVPNAPVAEPPQWEVQLHNLDIGETSRRGYRYRTRLTFNQPHGQYSTLIVENDFLQVCGAGQLTDLSGSVDNVPVQGLAVLVAGILNASLFGRHVHDDTQYGLVTKTTGYPCGDFFFAITDDQKSPYPGSITTWADLFLVKFKAKRIMSFKNKAHSPYNEIHMYHMDLMQYRNVLVARSGPNWVPLTGSKLDPDGIFNEAK